MVLEATVVCLDNSEWMRNGDYVPTRLEAQHDAVNLICGHKTQQNPENSVGVMTMAGKGEVLVTLTTDLGKILTSLHSVRIEGSLNFATAIQVATLALKHRQNKNQRQRVVAFVGSPIETAEKDLVRMGKKLKKNNVSVDVINFGEESDNTPKLEAFINAVNNKDGTSHLVTVPPGPHILSDILRMSDVLMFDDMGGAGGGGGGAAAASAFEFGVDPSLEPELALALRVSMEEERQRQERAAAEEREKSASGEGGETAATEAGGGVASGDTAMAGVDEGEDDLLAQALAMSVEGGAGGDAGGGYAGSVEQVEMSEEEQMALAMQMSMAESSAPVQEASTTEGGGGGGASAEEAADPAFLASVLGSLPGVDPNDARIRDVLQQLGGEGAGSSEEKKEDGDKMDES